MNKTKWLEMALPFTQADIWEKLNTHPYCDNKGYGLELVNVQDDFFEGVFTQKVIEREVIIDPFGVEATFSTVRYDLVSFSLFLTSPKRSILRINRSGRSIKFFLQIMNKILGVGVSIDAIGFDALSLINIISKELSGSRFQAKKVRLINISISKKTTMRAEVVSSDNVLTDIYSFFDMTSFLIDRISGFFEKESFSYSVEVSRSGLIFYPKEIEEAVLNAVVRLVND